MPDDPSATDEMQARPSSAGSCATCGKWVTKRYGGNGRYVAECRECWTRGWAHDMAVARAIEAARLAE